MALRRGPSGRRDLPWAGNRPRTGGVQRRRPWVRSFAGLLVISLALDFVARGAPGAGRVTVEPRETEALLANPGMGWQTFQRFADEDQNLQGLPSASAYFRFYWRELEPADGRIDFGKFDALLAHAHRAGQKLAFRVMCTGSSQYLDVPAWLKDQGAKGVEFTYGGAKHWVPDFADPLFTRAHDRLIRELGAHYDGQPDLDLVDIGSVGLWGEWHMSGTEAVATGRPVPLPALELRLAIIDAWCNAFPRTSKVMLIGSAEGMARAVTTGYGWRADCLGDMGGFSKTWNHMENFYPQQLATTGAQAAWRTAPVAFETCWDMRKWQQEGWDLGHIFDYALACHASYVNNKSAPIPPGTRPAVERLLRHLGYRLVIRRVEHAPTARPGNPVDLTVVWENVGVAPPYRDYRVAARLTRADAPTDPPILQTSTHSIRGWLPGTHRTDLSLKLAKGIGPGRYVVSLGVVDPQDGQPAVRLAIAGAAPAGWYPVSALQVVAPTTE